MRLFLLSLFLMTPFVWTQPQDPAQNDTGKSFKIGVSVDQVFLSVNARSVGGGFVRDLDREELQVFEDGVQQDIINFYTDAGPVSVVLLLDASGSTIHDQGAIQKAALGFANSLSSEDRIAVITFNHRADLVLDWTNDQEKVTDALRSVYAKGRTVLYDALYVTFDDLLQGTEGRTAVILLTDGADLGSMVGPDTVLDLAIRSEAMVYVVSTLEQFWAAAIGMRHQGYKVPSDEVIVSNRRFLETLSDKTGGRVFEVRSSTDLTDVYAQVAEELKHQYTVSYAPKNIQRDGRWRSVEVRALDPSAIVSTRPGYYAPSAPDA